MNKLLFTSLFRLSPFDFRWITKYIDEPKQSQLKHFVDEPEPNEELQISYKIYDWMLNNHENVNTDKGQFCE